MNLALFVNGDRKKIAGKMGFSLNENFTREE